MENGLNNRMNNTTSYLWVTQKSVSKPLHWTTCVKGQRYSTTKKANMAEGNQNFEDEHLHSNYRVLTKELLELEVINSELESIKKQNKIYIKRGGNLFFLDPNPQKTVSEHKRLLDVKRKEVKKLEDAIREKSSR